MNSHWFKPDGEGSHREPIHPLKRKRIRRKKYKIREVARRDVFDDIEFFQNPQRKHAGCGRLSPINFEQQPKPLLEGVQQTRGYRD